MSGPKISLYELSEEVSENLRQQIMCEQKTFQCVTGAVNLLQELYNNNAYTIAELKKTTSIKETGDEAALFLSTVKAIEELDKKCRELLETAKETPVTISAWLSVENLNEGTLAVKEAKLRNAEALKNDAVRSVKEMGALLGEAEEQREKLRFSALKDGLQNFDFDFTSKSGFETLSSHINGQLTAICAAKEIPSDIIGKARSVLKTLQTIKEIESLENFNSITVKKLVKQYNAACELNKKQYREREELIARCAALAALIGEEAAHFSKDDLPSLKRTVERLEKRLVKQAEQAYITDCVDGVMREMGYELLGEREVTKKSGKRFRNELFSFNEGTAVNITYSSDGKISMELGGIDTEDRLPSAAEATLLCEEMKSFCSDFDEIEKRLAVKGVTVGSRVSKLPPSADYASIINISGYKTEKEIQKISASNKKRVRTAKTMRRGDSDGR